MINYTDESWLKTAYLALATSDASLTPLCRHRTLLNSSNPVIIMFESRSHIAFEIDWQRLTAQHGRSHPWAVDWRFTKCTWRAKSEGKRGVQYPERHARQNNNQRGEYLAPFSVEVVGSSDQPPLLDLRSTSYHGRWQRKHRHSCAFYPLHTIHPVWTREG